MLFKIDSLMEINKYNKEYILEIIFQVINNHNKLNPKELKLEKTKETILMGADGVLDSLGLINFLVELETRLKEELKNNFSIIDENLFLEKNGPYSDIDNLSNYIFSKINENKS